MPVLKNAKHELVVQRYLTDKERIGWKAYKGVYPNSSQHAAETAFSRLLKNAEFKARIDEITGVAAEKTAVTIALVVDELAKIGFANMQDYITVDGEGQPFIDLSALDRNKAAAIQELTVETRFEYEGEGEDREQVPVRKVRFKLGDKRASLVDIARHLGAFPNKVEVTGKGGAPIETKDVSKLEVARRLAVILASATIAGGADAGAPAPKRRKGNKK